MRSPFCMPRRSRWTKKSNNMSLLDRFREAVFRLIMLSALSKAGGGGGRDTAQKDRYCNNAYEPHRSEAVADCIEFIKRSAIADDSRSSTGSCSIDGDMMRG